MLERKTNETVYEVVIKPTKGWGNRTKVAKDLITDNPQAVADALEDDLKDVARTGDSLRVVFKPVGKKSSVRVIKDLMIGKEALAEKINVILTKLQSQK